MITETKETAAELLHSNLSVNEKGHLCFAGMDTVELAKKHGTALYLIDENRIRNNARIYIDAMKKYLKGCKTPNSKFDCREAISAIISAGGIPIWAHPLGGEGEIHINQETFIERFKQMKEYGIQGLECYYSRYNKDEIKFLTNFAKENGMFISGGSDYHGTNKDIELYTLNEDKSYVEIENLTVLKDII
jgi:predicted metal-dependent phosphoesterase TrpH